MGRPKIEIDGALVEKLAALGCKTVEIGDHFGCDDDTITRRFPAELTKGRVALKTNLRQWQISAAKNGNITMLIWLGKQLLGQKDVTRIELGDIPDEVFSLEVQRRLKLVSNG